MDDDETNQEVLELLQEQGSIKDNASLRRPMNAFLIFCKKHRAIVKEHNPSLDNRAITRILGETWASLPPMQKASFLELAKQV